MKNMCQPTWPKYIDKEEYIKEIKKRKDLSWFEKLVRIHFVEGMKEER